MGFLDWLTGNDLIEEYAKREMSVGNDAFAAWLDGNGTLQEVTSSKAMGIPAFYRAVALISGTIATLPLKTFRDTPTGRKSTKSFLDRPAGPYPLTPFAWKELVMLHLLTRGEAFLLHIYNQAGALIGLLPIHPDAISKVEWKGAAKVFTVQHDDGPKEYTNLQMTQVMGLTDDGTRGLAPLSIFRRTIQGTVSAEVAARKVATSGLSVSALVTPEEDLKGEDAKEIKKQLDARMTGPENAGGIAVINRKLKVSPLSLTPEDAQFLQGREFNVTEIARIFGIPPHLLAQTEKQTSWGTGVAEQNLGLQRFTLMPWTSRIEESLSELLPNPRFVEFEYAGLLQGTPAQEIDLIIKQIDSGLLTVNEARAIRNLPPIDAEEEPQEEN